MSACARLCMCSVVFLPLARPAPRGQRQTGVTVGQARGAVWAVCVGGMLVGRLTAGAFISDRELALGGMM